MPNIAAIDVGSNAMRLAVAHVHGNRRIEMIQSLRAPVRLGGDVFSDGLISEASFEKTLQAFRKFKGIIEKHDATVVRAVATSATREAFNRDIFADRVTQSSGIELVPIPAEEEARLINLAIQSRLNLKNKRCLSIDIGGGSVELTLSFNRNILITQGYRIGTVRLLKALESKSMEQATLIKLINEYIDPILKRSRETFAMKKPFVFVGTGGNIEAICDLQKTINGNERPSTLSDSALHDVTARLQSMSYTDRVHRLLLRPDRADVILPASVILHRVVSDHGVKTVEVPKVGVKDGLLRDIVGEVFGEENTPLREQVMTSALQLGKRYFFDEGHGTTVKRYAVELFDQLQTLHNLPVECRLLLEVSALLHDIGSYVSLSDHHKHTLYILEANPIIGLTNDQMKIVAHTTRYHRKSFPKPQHDAYQSLEPKDRVVISKLAALLRLADAMDHDHTAQVRAFRIRVDRPRVRLALEGPGDMLLEKWSLLKKKDLFEQVFSVRLSLDD